MMQEAQELLKKALALSEKERADLASTLIESLDDTVDENAEAAWQEGSSVASKKFDPGKRRRPPGTTFARRGVRY
jgi:hypothetical protein